MTDKTYDILKKIGTVILPALAALVIAFGKIWNIPFTAEIAATLSAIAVFINAILQNESKKYFAEITEHEK